MSLFLTLLMVLAPMTTLIPALEESSSKLESYEATNGWGESLAYEVIEYDGIDWEVMPTRGVNTWIGNAISSFSDSVDDLDVAIGPDQVGQSLWIQYRHTRSRSLHIDTRRHDQS